MSSAPFRVPYENVFVDKDETKLVGAFGSVYVVREVRDANGLRFLNILRQGSDLPLEVEERDLVLEKFALSLIAPKETL